MKKIDVVGIAFGNFKRRKLRSVLTVLGVVIGTASIVTMMSLGIAMDESFSKSMQEFGDLTTINVNPGYDPNTGQQKGSLDDKLVEKLKLIDNVVAVSPEIRISGKVLSGRYMWYANIMGIDMANASNYGFKVDQGSLMTEELLATIPGKSVPILFGSDTPYEFAKPQRGGGRMGGFSMSIGGMGGDEEERPAPDVNLMDPLARLRYTFDWSYGEQNKDPNKKKSPLYSVVPVGILKKSNGQSDYSAYIDIDTAKMIKEAQEKFNRSSQGGTAQKQTKLTYDSVKVFAKTMEDVEVIVKTITDDMGYDAYGSGQWISQMKQQTGMIQMLLGGIGSVSLVVAAIGITNTMVMSIYERTREIGIMKVIGCYLKDIRTMFLVEAGFIGLFGGLVGVGISYGLSMTLNWVVANGGEAMANIFGTLGGGQGSDISVIPFWLAAIAVVFAIIVALISGFFPARRAMKLSALEAMKT